MGFEVFNRSHGGLQERITTSTVTIGSRGSITLSTLAYEAIGRPSYVEVLYDRDADLVGIRESNNPVTRYKVSTTGKKGRGWRIMATAFCREYGIDTGPSRRFPVKDTADGILIIDLRGPAEKVTSPRAKR